MIIRQEDLTENAIELGIWDALLEVAGIGWEFPNKDEAEIEILKAKQAA